MQAQNGELGAIISIGCCVKEDSRKGSLEQGENIGNLYTVDIVQIGRAYQILRSKKVQGLVNGETSGGG